MADERSMMRAPAASPAALRSHDSAKHQQSDRQVELPEREFLHEKLPCQKHREPRQQPCGLPAIGQRDNRQAHERPRHHHEKCEPRDLGNVLGHPRERRHEWRERRKIFVLVVAVLRAIERFMRQIASRRGARDREVDQLGALVANGSTPAAITNSRRRSWTAARGQGCTLRGYHFVWAASEMDGLAGSLRRVIGRK